MSTETPEQRTERWQATIERIYGEITQLHSNREIWQYLNEELPKHGGHTVNQTITQWYIHSQSAAVRRLASDRSQDGNSVYRLLRSIDAHIADFGGEKWGVTMTNESVQQDMEALKQTASLVSRWADENIAHIGRTSTANPTFNDLDASITTLGELFTKYNLAITGAYMPNVTPVITDNWRQPFGAAWF